MKFIKNLFNKNKGVSVKKIEDYSSLLNLTKPIKKEKIDIDAFVKNGHNFNVGDKVITKSNECVHYKVGVIISLDYLGSTKTIIPKIQTKNGETYTTMGAIVTYSKNTEKKLKELKPLEQWNHLVPKEVRYTKKEMDLKEKKYNSIKKIQ